MNSASVTSVWSRPSPRLAIPVLRFVASAAHASSLPAVPSSSSCVRPLFPGTHCEPPQPFRFGTANSHQRRAHRGWLRNACRPRGLRLTPIFLYRWRMRQFFYAFFLVTASHPPPGSAAGSSCMGVEATAASDDRGFRLAPSDMVRYQPSRYKLVDLSQSSHFYYSKNVLSSFGAQKMRRKIGEKVFWTHEKRRSLSTPPP